MTKDEYAQVMLVHSRYWPHFKPPKGTYEVWERQLLHYPANHVLAALDYLQRTEPKYAPLAGEIANTVDELTQVSDNKGLDEAWYEVTSNISHVGSYGVPQWSTPAIQMAVNAIGWNNLCMSENQMADRAHFIKIYGATQERAKREQFVSPIIKELLAGDNGKPLRLLRSVDDLEDA